LGGSQGPVCPPRRQEDLRSKGSHRIYQRQTERMVVPFHAGQVLLPKVVKQIMEAIEH
jgi:predicted RNA binding protein YcfA (HicA-like mRNA interferase family)